MMARNGAFGDETPPEGIPVAMGVLRNGPIDSDDDEPRPKVSPKRSPRHKPGDLLTETGEPRGPDDDEPDSPVMERLPRGSMPPDPRPEPLPLSNLAGPELPRKSSKRNSALIESSQSAAPSASRPRSAEGAAQSEGPPSLARLPFERTASEQRLSSYASSDINMDLSRHPSSRRTGERPASFGMVSQHSISRVDPELQEVDLLGASAEVVDDERSSLKRP